MPKRKNKRRQSDIDNLIPSPDMPFEFNGMPNSTYDNNTAWKLQSKNQYFGPWWPSYSNELDEFKYTLKI